MTMQERSAALAVGWIEAWIKMDMEWLRQRLAPDFVHGHSTGSVSDPKLLQRRLTRGSGR
jgi:hypothetical protein